jgi:hypothetical protein
MAPFVPLTGAVAHKARFVLKDVTGFGKKKGGKSKAKKILLSALDFTPALASVAPLALGPEGALLAPVTSFATQKARELLKRKTGLSKPKRGKKTKIEKYVKPIVSTALNVAPVTTASALGAIAGYHEGHLEMMPIVSALSQCQLQKLQNKLYEKTSWGVSRMKYKCKDPKYIEMIDHLVTHHPELWKGGKLHKKSVQTIWRGVEPIARVIGSTALDVILPTGAEAIGREFGLPEHTGRVLGSLLRETIRMKTGLGKPQTKPDIKPMPKPLPQAFKGVKKYTGGSKRKVSDKMVRRNQLVKKIMKEQGKSLRDASSYIKEHNLSY